MSKNWMGEPFQTSDQLYTSTLIGFRLRLYEQENSGASNLYERGDEIVNLNTGVRGTVVDCTKDVVSITNDEESEVLYGWVCSVKGAFAIVPPSFDVTEFDVLSRAHKRKYGKWSLNNILKIIPMILISMLLSLVLFLILAGYTS